MNARRTLTRSGLILLAAIQMTPASALPPSHPDPAALVRAGKPVSSIPVADTVTDFTPLDDEHVMLATRDKHYLLTLTRECFGLRWARHVGVTASDNTIWVGFDSLTADGQACNIRAIHLVPKPQEDAL